MPAVTFNRYFFALTSSNRSPEFEDVFDCEALLERRLSDFGLVGLWRVRDRERDLLDIVVCSI